MKEIHKVVNNYEKTRPKINMTTKNPSHRQIIVPISLDNSSKIMSASSERIANINQTLKNIKLSIIADFIYDNQRSLITTNNVTSC